MYLLVDSGKTHAIVAQLRQHESPVRDGATTEYERSRIRSVIRSKGKVEYEIGDWLAGSSIAQIGPRHCQPLICFILVCEQSIQVVVPALISWQCAERRVKMGGAAEQQALQMLSDKQDEQLASLIQSQPSSAIAAHISLDKLAHAGLPKSYVTLWHKSLAGQQTDLNEDESPAFALHRLIADISDKGMVFVSEVVAAVQLNGISLNQPNTVQDTLLHLAARSGHVQLCQLLVQHGADPLARNSKNRYGFAAV